MLFVAGGQEALACCALPSPAPALAGSRRIEQGRHFCLSSDTGLGGKGDSESWPTGAILRSVSLPLPLEAAGRGLSPVMVTLGLGGGWWTLLLAGARPSGNWRAPV